MRGGLLAWLRTLRRVGKTENDRCIRLHNIAVRCSLRNINLTRIELNMRALQINQILTLHRKMDEGSADKSGSCAALPWSRKYRLVNGVVTICGHARKKSLEIIFCY